ncbi:BamA/TamA family outer membrane protein [Allocoleopsis franciscana]|uniref:Outer membrane protein/protective antigen OMA87 n=1 Tax=Allocoleopsis franciscana PCC 7113 TaxID=1173027 RepID=K9WBI3_9CYAN|nr:BamA/TamA family outer membrane protein [Allocoleopsis franciscana]AFZ17750.1 outer membrane protein/protective antigen OMA87 [Allocoleopsis franciscana PCC 7113]
MLNRIVLLSTLALLAAGELTNQAIANPNPANSTPKPTASNYVVPVVASPASQSSAAIASPEASVTPVFSQSNSATTGKTVAVPTVSASPQPAKTSVSATPQTSAKPTNSVAQSTNRNDLAVTATDVEVKGATEELQQLVLSTIGTRAGGSTNQSQLDKDIAAILNTGYFANARVSKTVNRDGWNVVFQVEPVVVRSLQLSGNQVLTSDVANTIFQSQLGQQVSPTALRQGFEQLSQWYKDNGYVLAQVAAIQPNRSGVLAVDVAEGMVGDINFRFLDKDGKPTQGRTKEDFLKRELKLKSGEVFRVDVARQDLQQLYKLGLFDNANVSLNGDARQVDVTYDLIERSARGVNVGGGYSPSSGLFGTINYRDQNFGGVNKQLGLNAQIGAKDFQFDGNFTSPYRASNPDMPGYSVNGFRRRGISQTFDDDFQNQTNEAGNYEQPREGQIGGGISLNKPVGEWDGSLGLNYTRTSIRDRNGNIISTDSFGNPVSFSGTGVDDLLAVTAGVTRDERNNPYNPTQGSLLSLTTQQSIPVGNGNILMNRVQANYSQYTPVNILGTKDPQVLAFNVQGGTTIGDLPPYMAYNLGGINSVRGYGTGDLASGRSFVLASAEYRIPVFNPVGAVLFADFGSDLGSGSSVLGEPGVVRGKPGTGFGYGAGVRVNSPVGIIRADYAFTDKGDSRVQFGLGQRF